MVIVTTLRGLALSTAIAGSAVAVWLSTVSPLAAACAAGMPCESEPAPSGWGTVVRTQHKHVPPNTERMILGDSSANGTCGPRLAPMQPIAISIDGVAMRNGKVDSVADSQRCTDLALARADIQVRYDALAAEPRLNVLAAPDAALKGGHINFSTYTNYHAWIDRGEIRLFAKDKTHRQDAIAVIPVAKGRAAWTIPTETADEIIYVLRVYDQHGRFDETAPKSFKVADMRGGRTTPGELLKVYDGNSREVRNIKISGGAILVSGTNIRPEQRVYIMGIETPVDTKGAFAARHIVAAGSHQIDVSVVDKGGRVSEFSRSALIPDNDWFYVAMADFTAGTGKVTGPAAVIHTDSSDGYAKEHYVNGRGAFYLKGKIKGEYLLTAAADTKDQPVGSLFSNFDSKDPRYLLRKLDPSKYYPVYGDDSTLTEDAPTRGKFYVRLEKGDSNIMWGNFKTSITGTEFVRYDRGLYGARGQYASETSTPSGERTTKVEVFAAEPGTIAGRDIFRGTGGSLYYMRRQNITLGSERVSIEVRDRDTGLALASKVLVPTQDYEINYLQGRITLKSPLASTAMSDFIVQSGTLSGQEQFLVTTYEYAPSLEANKDKATGGRATQWVGDHVQVGVTGYEQTGAGRDQKMIGTDMMVRATPGTYIKAEIARSNGAGDGETLSLDGGFTFVSRQSNGSIAYAKRIEAAADLAELNTGLDGRLAAFWQHKDRDFSSPGQITTNREASEAGVKATTRLNAQWGLRAQLTDKRDEFRSYQSAEGNVVYSFNEYWKGTVGLKGDTQTLRTLSASPTLNQEGRRIDSAIRLDYDSHRDWTAYVFGQKTLDRTGTRNPNNRIGVGGTARVTENLTGLAEISGGDGGLGGKLGTEYKVNDEQTVYVNYTLDPDRTDIISTGAQGMLVGGARRRYSDNFSVFGEERYRSGIGYTGLTHAYGLDFVPLQHWKTGLAIETGKLHDPFAGDLQRLAASGSIGYSHAGLTYSGKIEYRHDETPLRERETWLAANTLSLKMTDDWRAVGKLSGAFNTKTVGDFVDGNFFEATTGFAYRPVTNDRLNMLFKHTYFQDAPSPGQVLPGGLSLGYAQRSQILAIDASYDLLPWLTVGGKYAYRIGELKDRVLDGPWFDARAQLAILRLDIKAIRDWDFLAELRSLDSSTASDRKTGALIGVYKHINDNFRVGVGYNFTDYSDNLTDLSNKSRGVFINGLAKY